MFCLTAVLRSDRKEVYHFLIRSLMRFKEERSPRAYKQLMIDDFLSFKIK
jgi:hypothetical protein